MTRYDLLRVNSSVLRLFLANKIDMRDVERLALFEEYIDMRNRGEKYHYTVQHLAQKYRCAPRSVMNVVGRMRSEVKIKC